MKKHFVLLLPMLVLNSCVKGGDTTTSTPNISTPPTTMPDSSTGSSTTTIPEVYTLSSHEEFIKASNNDVLYIKAHLNYVTKEFGSNHNYFFQDLDGGYYCTGTITLDEGKTYIIKGTKTYNNATKQHTLNGISLIAEDEEDIDVDIIDISDSFSTENIMNNYQGALVTVKGLKYTISQSFNDIKKTLSYARRENNAPSIRLMNYRDYIGQTNFDQINSRLNKIDINASFDVERAVFMNDYGTPVLVLLDSNDIIGGKLSDEEKTYNLVKNNIKLNRYIDSSIALATSIAGEEVVWASSNEALINNSGEIVSEVTENTNVRLTATITSINRSIEYDVIIIPHVEEVTSSTISPDLFISEIYEGTSSNNHAIELYNNTGSALDLSSYKVVQYVNGDEGETISLQLDGNLEHGKCIVIYDNQKIEIAGFTSHLKKISNEGIRTIADQVAHFNSNDPIALYNGNDLIDTIGYIGRLSNFMNNVTYYRNENSYIPETYWNSKNWTYVSNESNSTNYYEDLGYHSIGAK